MLFLVDTGVILRLFNRATPECASIRNALFELKRRGHGFALSLQNVAEFWSVATRPASARGGFGISVDEVRRQLRVLDRHCQILPDTLATYSIWRDLVSRYKVTGVQVHDARLVAWMISHGITEAVTLNRSDFTRYLENTAHEPNAILSAHPR